MSEYDEFDQSEDQDEGLRGLRQAKKAAEAEQKRLQEELATAQAERRELAALKAGLDPSDKAIAFFLRHYDGDPNADAMKAAAVEAGVLPDVAPEAAASVAGQAQMAAAFQGGEQTPLGSTTIGDRNFRMTVPADQAQMWQEAEQAAKAKDFVGMADILRRYGHGGDGIVAGSYEYEAGAGGPATAPISGRPV